MHSYARGDGVAATGEPSVKKKRSAPRSISEQELAEVQALCRAVGGHCPARVWEGRRGSLCLILHLLLHLLCQNAG